MSSSLVSTPLRTLDRFEIIEELGRGSQGVVYLARDPQLERNVAIKTFHDSSDFKAAQQQLLKEARSISRLQHPNILTLFEANKSNSQTYLVFEYIDGASLKKLLQFKGKLSAELALEIIIPVLDAIDYAHERGVIHRDLTPSNIIINTNNKPKLMDFGIADVLGRQTSGDTISSSLHYLSPEQCENKTPLPASDIFTIGLILTELLTGKPVITADNQSAIIKQIANEALDIPESISPAIREVI
ncbi:MAG: serine/threonine protein kinase, partial [Gammaproteobacteria bacterium]|nr:serine/threonine protein kinase [Gammaproteobacteria bacterium]